MNTIATKETKKSEGLRSFFIGIYKWMTAGVILSGIMAYITLASLEVGS